MIRPLAHLHLLLLGLLGLVLPLGEAQLLERLYSALAYPILWVTVVYFGTVLLENCAGASANLMAAARTVWWIPLLAGGYMTAIWFSLTPGLRIFPDEVHLALSAKALAFDQSAHYVAQALSSPSGLWPLEYRTDFRPLLFPFGVHLLHLIFGYSVDHSIVFNGLVTWILLILAGAFFAIRWGRVWGFCAMTLIAAQPLVPIYAVSGGHDLLAALLLISSFFALLRYLETRELRLLRLLVLLLLLLANVRFESGLWFLLLMTMLLALRLIPWRYFAESPLLALSPILLIPAVWQRVLKMEEPHLPGGEPLFLIRNFLHNNAGFAETLLNLSRELPYATLVNILGLAGLLILTLRFCLDRYQEKVFGPNDYAFIVCAPLLSVMWILTTFWSPATNPFSERDYISLMVVLCLFALFAMRTVSVKIGKLGTGGSFICAVALAIFYAPVAEERSSERVGVGASRYHKTLRYLRTMAEPGALVIGADPEQYLLNNYPAIDFLTARSNRRLIRALVQAQQIPDIYVVQEVRPDGSLTRSEPLTEFALIPVHEEGLEYGAKLLNPPYLRISKILQENFPTSDQ